VFETLLEQLDDVVVVEDVEDLAAVAASADQAHAAQEAELVRDGGLGHPEHARQILDTELGSGQNVENPDAGLVTEHLEGLGERHHGRRAEQLRPPLRGCPVNI